MDNFETLKTERAVDVLTAEDNYHPALVINLCICFESKNNRQKNHLLFYNFKKANLRNLYQNFLYINWDFLDECTDVNIACSEFHGVIYETLDTHVPKTRKRARNYPPWFSNEIIKILKSNINIGKAIRKRKDCLTYKNLKICADKLKSI